MKTVFCLFRSIQDAQIAIHDLVGRKYPQGEMNLIIQEQTAKNLLDINPRSGNIPVTGTEKNEIPALERILSGKQPITLPDTGRIFSSGELANVLTHSALTHKNGEPRGGLQAALIDFGLPKPVAENFFSGIKTGGVLFFLRTSDDRSAEISGFLRNQAGKNLVSYTG